MLAGFLILLAVSTLAHGLATLVRRRRQQFAVLAALGFTRAMTRAVVGSHSTAVGLVGLAVGIPSGCRSAAWGGSGSPRRCPCSTCRPSPSPWWRC